MKQRTIRIIKIVLGLYLTFVGSKHFINIYDQKPSDLYLQIAIAVMFVMAGILYIVQNVQKLLEKVMKEKAAKMIKEKAAEEERRYRELHSSSKFRTAPMRVIRPVNLEKEEEELEDFEEERIIVTNYEEEVTIEEKKESVSEKEEILIEKETSKESEQTVPDDEMMEKDVKEEQSEETESSENEVFDELTINNIEVSDKSEKEEK